MRTQFLQAPCASSRRVPEFHYVFRLRVWVGCLLIFVLASDCFAAQQPEKIETERAGPFILQVKGNNASIKIPLKSTDSVYAENLDAVVIDAWHGQNQVTGAITATVRSANSIAMLELDVALANIPRQRHGTYTVMLQFKSKNKTTDPKDESKDQDKESKDEIENPTGGEKKPDKPAKDNNDSKSKNLVGIPLILVLTYPETKLDATTPIVIDRKIGWFEPWSSKPRIFLRSTEGPVLNDLSATQADKAVVDGVTREGSLLFGDPVISADGTKATVEVSVNGDDPFPIGDATGKLFVESPGTNAVSVPFTVRTRLWKAYILAIVAAGLLIGFLMRVVLTNNLQKNEAKLGLRLLLRNVQRENKRRFETVYNQALKALAIDVDDEIKAVKRLSANDMKEIPGKIAEFEKRLQQALSDYATAFTTAENERVLIFDLATFNWKVPTGMLHSVSNGQAVARNAKTSLDANKLGEAKTKISEFEQGLHAALEQPYEKWHRAFSDGLDPPVSNLAVPEAVKTRIKKTLEDQDAAQGKLAIEPSTRKIDAIQHWLQATHTTNSVAAASLRDIKKLVLKEVHAAESAVDQTVSRDDLRNALANIDDPPPTRLEDPTSELADFWKGIDSVFVELSSLIRKQHGQNVPSEVNKRINDGRYSDAAIIPASQSQKTSHAKSLKGTAAIAGSGAFAAPFQNLTFFENEVADVSLPHRDSVPASSVPSIEQIDLDIEGNLFEIARDKGWQFFFAAIGISIAGFMVFQNNFAGTVSDCVSVFFWGLTSDIGVNYFLDQAKAHRELGP